ncbi:hypothetical protein VIGAN_10245600 [Vigna angularis var. angularis]|uniref:Uncharacterized protein n=1 Tax=Vigna angularis var. angularis TaxID=157739 RepID=A0A0S3T6H7_PHAAN|nr:hypothetical protein VIGAN_10245600 [Vigna angularis var. angularis]
MTDSTCGWPNEKALSAGEKTMIAISTPQSVQSSLAFLKSPERRFENVTCVCDLAFWSWRTECTIYISRLRCVPTHKLNSPIIMFYYSL